MDDSLHFGFFHCIHLFFVGAVHGSGGSGDIGSLLELDRYALIWLIWYKVKPIIFVATQGSDIVLNKSLSTVRIRFLLTSKFLFFLLPVSIMLLSVSSVIKAVAENEGNEPSYYHDEKDDDKYCPVPNAPDLTKYGKLSLENVH